MRSGRSPFSVSFFSTPPRNHISLGNFLELKSLKNIKFWVAYPLPGGYYLKKPVDKTPSENIWRNLENIKTPEKKFAREAREKILGFLKAVLQGKMIQKRSKHGKY